ncbi:16S rRNA (guanine(527)-N(7))-methyltransferase RsmG [Tessaracoccus sp. MC1865]|uniref:16S rRNA (guanine(527)-N(7))-methyltransferase RsmG n=1 Tax=Tessaracoccus sp. MC1865 TaxID=2760310 RepID=UPI0016032AA8|nr:16S rRNA (guanine(527)-N(7))-methyltransferase RsmG [Tessaracoccus sp. MC1865]MBB1483045.1 16S rRNA (guanine(527)-N(7))-methyltransferase RsmG [Tessaracoccus sp. MC1865]QTO37523.1 16S rRNA (guanine(527)-N(7))-methyltransferase RsmG [Tessaracoccus sp. MC1865]
MELDPSELEHRVAACLFEAYPQRDKALSRYVDILGSRGIEWGLMGPREGDKLWQRHVANSLAVVDAIPQGLDVADIGSGAGLPGIPLAIVRPDLRITLIESLQRRCEFLELAVDELGLGDRVEVRRGRAEEVKERFDVVTCRAVAPLEKLLRWTTPLFSPDGMLLALKGASAEEEIRNAANLLKNNRLRADILELQAAPGVEGTRAIRVTRASA